MISAGDIMTREVITVSPDLAVEKLAEVFWEMEMDGLVCGFNAGNGPNPLKDDEADHCLANLRQQAEYAIALAESEKGQPVMVGPMHTHHMNNKRNSVEGLKHWLTKLHAFAIEINFQLLFEPLNATEDNTPDPFHILYNAMEDSEMFGLHWDTGHAHARGMTPMDLMGMADKIGFLEFTNAGRWPLDINFGIPFAQYIKAMDSLPEYCVVGVEPFDQSVIETFGLGHLCTTTVPGEQALKSDFNFLYQRGVVA